MSKPKIKSFDERKVDLAILESQDAIQADPNNWEAHYNLANIYFSQKEYQLAENIFLTILSAGNKSYAVFRGLGNVCYAQKKFKEAAGYFEKAVELKYKDPESHYALAIVYFKLKEEELFVQECTRALVVDPNFARAHYSMGFYYAQQKKLDHAIKELVKATQLSPADPDAHFLLMKIYLKKKDEKKAMEQCVETLKYDPKHVEAHYQQGLFAEKFEDYAMAVREFIEVKSLKEDYPDISEKIANTLKKEEEKYFKEMQETPNDPKPYLSLADLYYEVGRLDLAAEKCEEALAVDKQNIMGYSNLGVIYASLNKYMKAMSEYKKALKIDPQNSSVKENLLLAIRLGLKYYRSILEKNPQDSKAWDSLILIQRERGDLLSVIDTYEEKLKKIKKDKQAEKEYEEFGLALLRDGLQSMKKDSQDVYKVGLAYMAIGDLGSAEEVFNIFLKNNPKDVRSLYILGKVQIRKKDLIQALANLQKVYRLDPSYRDTFIMIREISTEEVKRLKQKIQKDPQDIDTLKKITEIFEAQQLYAEALEYYQKLKELDPENKEIQQKYNSIRDNYENQLKRYVDQAALELDYYLELGKLYEDENSLSKAIQVYGRGLKLFPREAILLDRYYKAVQGAIGQFEKFLKKDPNNAEVLFALASFSVTVGYQLKALEALAKAVEINSTLAERARVAPEFQDLRGNVQFQEITKAKGYSGAIDKVVE
ncbi:tetratricopeptide repeat protein [Candidatus Margulisiibacteriota bacterium]